MCTRSKRWATDIVVNQEEEKGDDHHMHKKESDRTVSEKFEDLGGLEAQMANISINEPAIIN